MDSFAPPMTPIFEDTGSQPPVLVRQFPIRPGHKQVETARVLHVINGEHYSGAERVQDLLAGGLPDFGFGVAFACVKPGRFPEVYTSREAPVFLCPMRGKYDLRAVWRLVGLVRSGEFGLLHAHTPRTAMVAALASAATGVPLVYHVHSPAFRDSTSPWRNRLNALVERASLARAAAIIAVSRSLGEQMRRYARAGRPVFVVPNGVPCRIPRPVRARGCQEWTLGTVALFRPRKGIEVLLEALAALRSERLSVRLKAVGDFETAEYGRQVVRQAEQLGLSRLVEWAGFTADVDSQLRQMDLFVLPSLFGEGLPMVILEAMAAGVPVVATRVEGIPEAVRDGREGLLAEPGDPASLSGAIRRVIHGEVDWHGLQTAALKRQTECFSDRSMAAGVAAVYRRVLLGQKHVLSPRHVAQASSL